MTRVKPLTNDQKQFIRENYPNKTREEMAAKLQAPFRMVDKFCCSEGLKKTRIPFYKKKDDDLPKLKIKRPPTVYSNRSHEDVLNYYENLEV